MQKFFKHPSNFNFSCYFQELFLSQTLVFMILLIYIVSEKSNFLLLFYEEKLCKLLS